MSMAFKEEIQAKILRKNIAEEDELIGCTHNEIQSIMNAQGVTWLPVVYVEFMGLLGKQAGSLWKPATFKYPHAKELMSEALRLLKQNGNPIELKQTSFVLQMQEGMIFYYFDTSGTIEDPPVFVFSEIECEHAQVDEKLSLFLLNIY